MIRRGTASRRHLFSALSRAGLGLALVLGVFAVIPVPAAQATGNSDPGGNNGTVKIVEEGDFDSIPNNHPHVGCAFTVEWYGFDEGSNIISTVTFEMQAPTQGVGLTVDGPPTVFVGGDNASGAGTPSGLDGRQKYTLSFAGPPHPIQGFHLKLTIETPGSQGNDKKYKVFWVEGCEPPNPSILMTKSVADSNDADAVGSLGELLTYSFSVTNTAHVSTSTPDANTADNSDSATFQVTSGSRGLRVASVATVSNSSGRTQVMIPVTSARTRGATTKLIAIQRVKGTRLRSGSLLARSATKLHAGKHTVRLTARHAAAHALRQGAIRKARLVIVTRDGHRTVWIVKIRA